MGRKSKKGGRSLTASLLARCDGFTVDVPGGHVGVVDEVVWGDSRRWDRPEALAVRTGPEGKKTLLVPAEAVEEVLPEQRRVVVRQSALGQA